MAGFLISIHTIAAIMLILVILMQSGRGGGLTEGFAPAESLFGAKTNQFMVRATVVVAFVFLVTSLSLAYVSARREASLIPESAGETAPQPSVLPGEVQAPLVVTPNGEEETAPVTAQSEVPVPADAAEQSPQVPETAPMSGE